MIVICVDDQSFIHLKIDFFHSCYIGLEVQVLKIFLIIFQNGWVDSLAEILIENENVSIEFQIGNFSYTMWVYERHSIIAFQL